MSGSLELLDLPPELLIVILQCDVIKCEDLASVYETCCSLRKIASLNSLWMNKMLKRWPSLLKCKHSDMNWHEAYRDATETHEFLKNLIMSMSPKYYWSKVTLSDCHMADILRKGADYKGLGFDYMVMFLQEFCTKKINYTKSTPHTGLYNMTNQHYGMIFLDYLNRHYLKMMWIAFGKHPELLTAERTAMYFARWMQPELTRYDPEFSDHMMNIVNTIKILLPPRHPLLSVTEESFDIWGKIIIRENQYDPANCRTVIKLTCEVLHNLQLMGYAEPTSSSLIIRNVMDKKETNIMYNAIILEAVLRRCGIRVDVIYFSDHRLVAWRENWTNKTDLYFINPLTGEIKMSVCPFAIRSQPHQYEFRPTKILRHITEYMKSLESGKRRSFYKRCTEIMALTDPGNIEYFITLADVYIDFKKDVRDIEKHVRSLLDDPKRETTDEERSAYYASRLHEISKIRLSEDSLLIKKTIKHRSSTIQLAVGLVCYHKQYGYLCVIYGWDYVCLANSEWKANMGVQNLEFGEKQPFYHILATDLSERYVAEENLVCVLPAHRLECIEEKLAMYFSHFNGCFYIPNVEKEEEYPEDAPIRSKYEDMWFTRYKDDDVPSPQDE